MNDVLGVVGDQLLQGRAVASQIPRPQYGGVVAVNVLDRLIPANPEFPFDRFQSTPVSQAASDPSQIDVDGWQPDILEGEPQEAKVEAGAVESDNDRILFQTIRQILEILPIDEHLVAVPIEKPHHRDGIENRREAGRLNVKENSSGCKLRKESPGLTLRG